MPAIAMASECHSRPHAPPSTAERQGDERITVALHRYTGHNVHDLVLPVQVEGREVQVSLDTGSCESILQKSCLRATPIRPSEIKEYKYVFHSVEIVGEACVPMTIDNGSSSLDFVWKVLVADTPRHEDPINIFAMDFLGHFECEFDIASHAERLTLSRTRRRPEGETVYDCPSLRLPVAVGKGRADRACVFYVDTGAHTIFDLSEMQSRGLRLIKRAGPTKIYNVKDQLSIRLGHDRSRALKGVQAADMGLSILGDKNLNNTIINLKDWTMTFKSAKGDVTLPFLKRVPRRTY